MVTERSAVGDQLSLDMCEIRGVLGISEIDYLFLLSRCSAIIRGWDQDIFDLMSRG
jgi:hypothetical protein